MSTLATSFERAFGRAPQATAAAPGRVNVLGEHTDYNGGFVLPTVIDQRTVVSVAASPDGHTRLHSSQYPDAQHPSKSGWERYITGCLQALRDAGFDPPAICAWVDSTLPIGKGLSSSAALEVATIRALRGALDLAIDDVGIARVAQLAEVRYAGVSCGIMDQMAVSLGAVGQLLLLDTASLAHRKLPIPVGTELCVVDTGIERALVDTAYNERRRECEAAAQRLGLTSLRQLDDPARAATLPPPLNRRVRHVLSENARVLRAVNTVGPEEFGHLMNASHASLRDDYEVSTSALDHLVALLQQHPAVHGARLTGAGFGGACVALVRSGMSQRVCDAVLADYAAAGYRGARLA